MKLKIQAKHIGKIIQESSPTILTGLGVVGVIGTGYLVAKATWQAQHPIRERQIEIAMERVGQSDATYEVPLRERALLVWRLYIPAAGVGSLTIAAIIASNRIHARRLAALAAGYAILSKDFDEYREKAYEKLGIKKADELKKDIATTKVSGLPVTEQLILPAGKTWFMDGTTGRLFAATMEDVKYAQNDVNYKINNEQAVSVNEFYDSLGLEHTSLGNLLGWQSPDHIEIQFAPVLTADRGAVTSFTFAKDPKPNFWRG